jgi:hypothetical protein
LQSRQLLRYFFVTGLVTGTAGGLDGGGGVEGAALEVGNAQ